jgi:hypothetical protein
VLWEGATEKKVMLDCAAQTPGRQVLLSEDARGQASGVPGMGAVKSRLVEDALMTGHRDQKEVCARGFPPSLSLSLRP